MHAFQTSDEEPADAECEGDEGSQPAYREWQLPARAFASLWESLIYEEVRQPGATPMPAAPLTHAAESGSVRRALLIASES